MYEYRKLNIEQKRELVQSRLDRGFPPHSPPHYRVNHAIYLLTAACYEHQHHMSDERRRVELLDRFFEEAILADIDVRAWVVLPNHYHILAMVTDFGRLTDVYRKTHGSTSYKWNSADGKKGRKVWYRYADRLIRSEDHYSATLNYIHFNPVKHRLVESPYDWQVSSIHWYSAQFGRDWLRDTWKRFPIEKYGEGWDNY